VQAEVRVTALPTLPHRLVRQREPYRLVDPDVHLDVVVPQLARAPVLNRRLRGIADTVVHSFRATLRADADRPGRYHAVTVGWQLLGQSRRTTGIQLWVAQQHGLKVTIDQITVWYDVPSRTVLTLTDLLSPQAQPAVVRAIARALTPSYPVETVRAALAAEGPPKGKGATFGFSARGDLLVTFGAGRLAPAADPVSVRVAGGPLEPRLSAVGRAARAAAYRDHVPVPPRTDCAQHKCVALTFDDGPGSFTAELVAILQQRAVPATFFVVGDRVRQSPDLLATVSSSGMEIGNHSTFHQELTLLGAREVKRDLRATNRAITAATGRRPNLLRPPYGSRNVTVDRVGKDLGLAEILWDVDTLDWRSSNPRTVTGAAVGPARRGSIILLHDIHRTSVEAVPGIVRGLRREGFTLVTVSDLLEDRTTPGHVYRQQPHRNADDNE